MSEIVDAPPTTHDIAASVVQEAESQDSAPVDTAPVTETPAPAADPQMSAAEELLRAEGYNPKRIDGRDNLIPWSRVAKIIEKGITEGKGDFGQKYQKLTTDHETITKEAADLRAFRDDFAAALRGDETAFLRELANHDPRYARFLEQKIEQARQEQPVDDPEPGPDLDFNGSRTYSLDGLKKREAWLVRQVEKKFEERLKPFADREKSEKERADTERAQTALRERVTSQIEQAKQWPSWAEYEEDIKAKLAEDTAQATAAGKRPSMSLREAYLEVKADRLSTDHNTVREKVIKELQGAPKSTAVTRPGVEPTRQPSPRSTQDIARQVIAQANAG